MPVSCLTFNILDQLHLSVQKEKRSIVTPTRLATLRKDGAVYVITCGKELCTCDTGDRNCARGFFSLFLQVVYGIEFSQRVGVPYHVDFGSLDYCYTDKNFKEDNFWNYYFDQPIKKLEDKMIPIPNREMESFPLRVWNRNHFRELNKKVIRTLLFSPEVNKLFERARAMFKNKSILGVQIRATDHKVEILPVKFEKVRKVITQHILFYDGLFVATDDNNVLQKLKSEFGDKVICNSVTRSIDNNPVHRNNSISNRYSLGVEVIIDCYCLSLCSKALLMQSNISYAAMLFNPELPYILLERTRPKIKRLKTLLLYHLNRLGIRKW